MAQQIVYYTTAATTHGPYLVRATRRTLAPVQIEVSNAALRAAIGSWSTVDPYGINAAQLAKRTLESLRKVGQPVESVEVHLGGQVVCCATEEVPLAAAVPGS